MVETRQEIRFLLNDEDVRLDQVSPMDTLLDFLRLDRKLKGTKEGCAEGDCGACTVLVGRLAESGLVYEPVTSCIRLLPSLDRRHVVTIEALSADGALHPVQQAMVENHGSQCGFCTPGIVMSLYALWRKGGTPTHGDAETALQGNLCRCTGYAPILRAAQAAASLGDAAQDPLTLRAAETEGRLRAMDDGRRVDVSRGGARAIAPATVEDLASTLSEAAEQSPTGARIVAGATDVGLWVTKDHRDISPAVFIDHLAELRVVEQETNALVIGGGVSYAELLPVLEKRHPWLVDYWRRIGGEQVRSMGTIGGNIANGSPIGDTPPPFIALGAELTLRSTAGRRTLSLEDFFIAYGEQDRRPDEFVETIRLPDPPSGALVAAYKVSKRRDEDISAVAAGFLVTIDGGTVQAARLAYGGMAATPKRADVAEAALVGEPWNERSIDRAADALAQDITPLSDWRASAAYRLTVAKNLLRRFYLETRGESDVRLERRVAV